MEQLFPTMTDAYRQKHYKDGVFARMQNNTAKVSILVYIFMGAVFLAGAYGTWWSLTHQEAFREADLTVFGYIMAAVCALFALVGLACIIISARRQMRGPEEWKERCAEESGCTVADLERFERQVQAGECRVLCLIDPLKKTVQGQEDGILTQDYIALTLNRPVILKLEDVRTACLFTQVVKAGSGTDRVGITYLCVGLMGKNGASVVAECSRKTGDALIALLKERIPNLDTAGDEVLDSDGYDALWASKYGKERSRP